MPAARRTVSVKVGHISGTAREFKVPSALTVGELLERFGTQLNRGEEVLDSNAESVTLSSKVKAGEEYTIASDLKAR